VLCSGHPPRPPDLPMPLSVDLFFSFRSPYSYLALPKTMSFVADYDAAVNLRPVYPLAVRVPGFFKKAHPQFARYIVLDSSRVAKHENIPFRFPRPDPIWRMESKGLTRRSRC
jgi:2-hydroxychromene-2-carboxylate isomerase